MLGLYILSAFIVSLMLSISFARPNHPLYVLDNPVARSLHSMPTPTVGGLAILAAIFTAALMWHFSIGLHNFVIITLFCTLPLAVISFIDDKNHVPAIYRLLVHFSVAIVIACNGLYIGNIQLPAIEIALTPSVSFIFSILFIAWSINLFNFMDGLDGLAAGMAVIGFSILATFGLIGGDKVYMTFNAIVAAAAAGFLIRNFAPARIFMGDCGSSVLGFFMAVSCLWGDIRNILPLWVSLLIFSPFIVDTGLTLIKKMLKKEKVWQPGKSHFYHLLVRSGWSQRRTVFYEYALMLTCGVSSFLILTDINIALWALIVFWFLVYLMITVFISARINNKLRKNGDNTSQVSSPKYTEKPATGR